VKAEAAGRLRDVRGKSLTAEQMEIARLKAERHADAGSEKLSPVR
jgi:hypothetical protein